MAKNLDDYYEEIENNDPDDERLDRQPHDDRFYMYDDEIKFLEEQQMIERWEEIEGEPFDE
jgi:hypothetical protein